MSSPKTPTAASVARLVAYGAAASAAATASVSADVVYFNPTDVTTPTTGARFIYFNPSNGSVAVSPQPADQAANYPFVIMGGTAGPPAFKKDTLFRNAAFPNNDGLSLRTAGGYIARLAQNAVIGAGGLFGASPNTLASGTSGYGNWNALGTGFVGLKFGLPDGQHLGWAQITIASDYRVTLLDFAYESTVGASIRAGQTATVPEPATTSLLAFGLGAAGLGAYRARRRAQAVA